MEESSDSDEDGDMHLILEQWILAQKPELTQEIKTMFTRRDKGQAYFEKFVSFITSPSSQET